MTNALQRYTRSLLICAASSISVFTSAQETLILTTQDRPVTVDASGTVVSQNELRFGPPPGHSWQTSITQLASEGQRVQKGALLASFDASNTDDRLRRYRGDLDSAEGEIKSMRKNQAREVEEEKLRLAAKESAADKAARKADQPAGLVPGIDYEKLIEERRIAEILWQREQSRVSLTKRLREARIKETEARIKQLRARLDAANAQFTGSKVIAPREGLVIIGTDPQGRKFDVNTNVHPGLVVVKLVDDSTLAIDVEIPEHQAALLNQGQPARIILDAQGGTEVAASVISVANTVRRQSRGSLAMVRDAKLTLASDDVSLFRIGMSVRVSIEVDVQQNVLAIPESSVQYRSGSPGVLMSGGEFRPVVLGRRSEGHFIVVSGLSSGNEIQL